MNTPAAELNAPTPGPDATLASPEQELQQLLVETALEFVGMSAEETPRGIEFALKRTARALGCDAGFVCLYPPDKQRLVLRYLYRGANVPIRRSLQRDLKSRWFPWGMQLHSSLKPVVVDDTRRMPKEATVDRRLIETLGLVSFVAIPMSVEGELIGSLGFGSSQADHDWLELEIELLGKLGRLITGALQQQQAVEALKESEGRFRTVASYAAELVFDADLEALEELAVMRNRHRVESLYEREQESHARATQELVGESQVLTAIHHHISRVAPTHSTVLILGETGTGKELVARAVHRASLRADRIMVKVDCGALPPTLIESELFGHEKGSFTGAIQRKLGLFELADGGTIFLDEIGDLPIELQAKLLRVLQEGEFVRIGSTNLQRVDVRVIAATNRPLDEAMRAGEFRPDLFYRLSVFPIEIPPLRNRQEDIPVLVHHFLKKTSRKLSRDVLKVPRELMESFIAYDWPGNVRELENLIECAAVFSSGNTLSLPYALISRLGAASGNASIESLQDMERKHIAGVLHACNWRVKGKGNAAERLQLNPSTLYSRMRKLGLKRPR